jgi:NhaP-type Na+/H+ or K+/H+ antiporter
MLSCSYSNICVRQGGKYARKHVPLNIRQLISAESAANDGLAFPFLTIALYLMLDSSWRVAITNWVLVGCLCMLIFRLSQGFLINLFLC